MNLHTTRLGLLGFVAVAAVGIAGCSSSDSDHNTHNSGAAMSGMGGSSATSSAQATGSHNKADITFATDMIPHHSQAVEMADMALATSKNAKIVTLAKAIKGAQDPEIKTMSSWLTSWGQPVPSSHMGMGGMSGHNMDMPGMMTDAAMGKLAKSTGATFDKLWLTMMTEHHTGAITMAKTELADGSSTDAKTLATSIISDQTSEITVMKKLLADY